MPFAIPSLQDLVERSRQGFRAHLKGSDAWLWPNNVYASAKVIAGAVHELFGFADYIQRQKFALTADGEHLDLHGEEFGLARRPAAPARGLVAVTASAAVAIDEGAIFRRADGVEYRSLVIASLGGAGTVTVDVVATTEGKATNAVAGEALAIVSGVTTSGTATAAVDAGDGLGIAGGDDVEVDGDPFTSDLATFRGRILFRKRNPPHGGSAADYVLWASSLAGVTRVYVERLWTGPGSVRVFVLMDDLYPNGIPPVAEIARVADYIETVRPAGADVTVAAPSALAVNVTVQGLSPDTTPVRDAVAAELALAFRRLGRVAGTDTAHGGMPYLATPFVFSRSWLWQAVANATGEERHTIAAPLADTVASSGQLPVLGTLSFIA